MQRRASRRIGLIHKTEKDNEKQHNHHHCGRVNAMHGQINEKVI